MENIGMEPPRGCYTVSRYTSFAEPIVSAYLWNPPVDEIELRYPYKDDVDTETLEPALVLTGNGLPHGDGTLAYALESGEHCLEHGTIDVEIPNGWFETRITPSTKFPQAERVSWSLQGAYHRPISGTASLVWSRFHGTVKYLDGRWRSSHIDMRPVTWGGAPTNFTLPVGDDGTFDALVPARVYGVLNVNGTGYGYDALERWAWDYDLTVDREDEFLIGRTELYGMRVFDTNGGPSTLFVIFRPTALSRLLRYDEDNDGFVQGSDRERLRVAMKASPTAIGPELTSDNVIVWYDGQKREIVQFDRIPEYCGDGWQVQYLLQISVGEKPPRGVWKEVKVEIESREQLHGTEVVDFGQGSVGFCLP
jgi:hypothetical protein